MPETTPNRSENKIVFIIGHPRSGTTWLMWLLGQHPAVAACNHAGFFHALEPLHTWWKAGTKFGKNIHVFTRADREQSEAHYEQVKLNHLLERAEFAELLHPLAETVFHRITTAKPGATVAVEQTPENMLFAGLIQELLPGAHFLHIIRDPRAVAASMQKAVKKWADPSSFPSHPVPISRSWNLYMDRGEALAEQTRHFKTIRYEDLRANGSEHLHDIYQWLEIDSTIDMCARFLEASSIDRMRSEEGLMPRGFFRRGLSLGWQQDLRPQHIRTIEFLTGDWMKKLEYPLVYPPAGRKPRMLRLYERAARFRAFTHGGFAAVLRRFFGGSRFTRAAARRLRVGRSALRRLDE